MEFNFEEWRAQLAAGRFDGHLADMHTRLGLRAAGGRARWVIRWQDRTWTEDDLLLETVVEAERHSGLAWSAMNLLLQLHRGGHAQSAQAILHAIATCELGWDPGLVEETLGQLRARDLAEIMSWEDREPPPGKDQPPAGDG